ncbi:gamma-glutamyltransferase [Escherichia coli]
MNSIDYGMNVAEATNAPRFHHQWLPDELRVEKGFSPDTLKLLEAKGQKVALKEAMGSTQSIMVGPDGELYGASDPRSVDDLTAVKMKVSGPLRGKRPFCQGKPKVAFFIS